MPEADRLRREEIDKRLKPLADVSAGVSSTPWWPWCEFVADKYRNWDLLIPDLHRELQQDGGEITDYFVGKFVEIAEFAKPILDDVEGNRPG